LHFGGRLGRFLALAFCLSVAFAPAASASAPPEQKQCVRTAGQFSRGTAFKQPVTLTPDVPAETVNFGGDRGWQFADVVLRSSQPLPGSLKPSQLDIEVLRRFTRQSETLRTIAIEAPRFTEPRINQRRTVITFTVCINGASLGAGHYAGAITIEGPSGIEPANVVLNINAQNETMFWATVSITGLLVLFLLFWRGATTAQGEAAKQAASEVKGADASPGGVLDVPAQAAIPADKALRPKARWALRKDVVFDPLFWISTLLSTAVAVGAAWAVFSANTGWGGDPVADIFALASAILAAAGFRSLITSAAGK
jgi:hypothetical protein